MGKKGEILKTVIVFLFFLFGCSHKYVDTEGKSLDEKIVASWEELDCRIIEQDEQGFSMNSQIKYMAIIKDSLGVEWSGRRGGSGKVDILPLLGGLVGYFGCLGGCYYVKSQDYLTDKVLETGCFISSISCLAGFTMIVAGSRRSKGAANIKSDFRKADTLCVDSVLLSRQKIKISVEKTGFEEIYWTDRGGNIGLKFDEIIPEPTEADSVLELIIRYEDLADSVKVRRL